MLSFVMVSMSLFVSDLGEVEAKAHFRSVVVKAARGELAIVDRLQNLRRATQKLPTTWKASGVTKEALLQEIETMELSAADRWALIMENTARLDLDTARMSRFDADLKRQLESLPQQHLELNSKIDAFNARIKDGIILNMASKIGKN